MQSKAANRLAVLLLLLHVSLIAPSNAFFWKSKEVEPAKSVQTQHYYYNEITYATQWTAPQYEHVDEEGRTFFIDPDTNEAVWEKPTGLQWAAAMDEQTQETYYYNEATHATQWEKPIALAWVQVESDKTEL